MLAEELHDRPDVLLEAGTAKAVAREQVGCTARVEADRVVEVADRLTGGARELLPDALEAQRVLDEGGRNAQRRLPPGIFAREDASDLRGRDRLRIDEMQRVAD